jgi:phospholipid transport system substrate-binding protein
MNSSPITTPIIIPASAALRSIVMPGLLALTMVICGMIAPVPAAATDQQDAATAVVEALISDVEALLEVKDASMDDRRSAITALLDAHFAMDTIAAFSTGPYWRAATPEERDEYKRVFREVLVSTILGNFDQLYGLEYTAGKATPKGDRFVVVSGIFADTTGARPQVAVNWRVITRKGKPVKLFDIEIENLSLLVTQQQENVAVIRKNKGRFSALIDVIRDRIPAQ